MSTLEKLRADIALDADLPIDQQLASLTSDAVALAMRLDDVLASLKPARPCPGRDKYGDDYHHYVLDRQEWERINAPYARACAIAEGAKK